MKTAAITKEPEKPDFKGLDVTTVLEREEETGEVRENIEFVPSSGADVMVFARTPEEMARSQMRLVRWAEAKVKQCEEDLAIREENLEAAREAKIRTQGWTREVRLSRKSLNYYTKMLGALRMGYFMVPDFPFTTIGVRTMESVSDDTGERRYQGHGDDLAHQELPMGEGAYKDPRIPEYSFDKDTGKKDDKGHEVLEKRWTSEGQLLRDVDFPMRLVRPHLLKDLQQAMGAKIFDAIGVYPGPKRQRQDPMLFGVIENRIARFRTQRQVFLIKWWINTEDL